MANHKFYTVSIDSKNTLRLLEDGYQTTDFSRSAEAAMDELYSNGFYTLMNACKSNRAFVKRVHTDDNHHVTAIVLHMVNVGEYAILPLYYEYDDITLVGDALDYLLRVIPEEHGSDYTIGHIYLYPLEGLGETEIQERLLSLGYISTGSTHRRESYIKRHS